MLQGEIVDAPSSAEGQIGRGIEQPDLVEYVPTHGRWLELDDLIRSLPTQ